MKLKEMTTVPYLEVAYFFRRIKGVLRLRGDTLFAIGKEIGCNEKTIYDIFQGKIKPQPSTLIRLYKVLNLSHVDYGMVFREHLIDRLTWQYLMNR